MCTIQLTHNIPIELFSPTALADPSLAARARLRRRRRWRLDGLFDVIAGVVLLPIRLDKGIDDDPLLSTFSSLRVAREAIALGAVASFCFTLSATLLFNSLSFDAAADFPLLSNDFPLLMAFVFRFASCELATLLPLLTSCFAPLFIADNAFDPICFPSDDKIPRPFIILRLRFLRPILPDEKGLLCNELPAY